MVEFTGLHAAHIFPVARQAMWNSNSYATWISDTSPATAISSNKIYSPQNGLLLQASIHGLFDTYRVAINPHVRNHLTPATLLARVNSNNT
jgi:hypothetical protein